MKKKTLILYIVIISIICLLMIVFNIVLLTKNIFHGCPSDLSKEVFDSRPKYVYDDYILNVFYCYPPGINNQTFEYLFNFLLAFVYVGLGITCYILFICLLCTIEISPFVVSIILYLIQMVIEIRNIIHLFGPKMTIPDKIFDAFGQLATKMREAYDKYLKKLLIMKICVIFLLIISIFCMIAHIIIFINLRKNNSIQSGNNNNSKTEIEDKNNGKEVNISNQSSNHNND